MAKSIHTNKKSASSGRFYDHQYLSMPPTSLPRQSSRSMPSHKTATPIPPRASALPSTMIKRPARRYTTAPQENTISSEGVRLRSPGGYGSLASRPTRPPQKRLFQEPVLDLSVLDPAPLIDEIITQPPSSQRESPSSRRTKGLALDLAEIDTLPPGRQRDSSSGEDALIATQTTRPTITQQSPMTPLPVIVSRELSPIQEKLSEHDTMMLYRDELVKETGLGTASRHSPARRTAFHPIDSLRWWLILPGRIEFLFWLGGTLLLVCFSALFAFAIASNLGHANSGSQIPARSPDQGTPASLCTESQASQAHHCTAIMITSSTGLKITLPVNTLTIAAISFSLHGQGFSSGGRVLFTHDGSLPCDPSIVSADKQGTFEVVLDVTDIAEWAPGNHQITVSDTMSNHTLTFTIKLLDSSQKATAAVALTPSATSTFTNQNILPGSSDPGTGTEGTSDMPVIPSPTQEPVLTPTPSSRSPSSPQDTGSSVNPTPPTQQQPSPTSAPPTTTVTTTPVSQGSTPPASAATLPEEAALRLDTLNLAHLNALQSRPLLLIGYGMATLLLGVALLLMILYCVSRLPCQKGDFVEQATMKESKNS
jgi:hypothetical protein